MEEQRRKKLERLDLLKMMLMNKQNLAEDFKSKHDIDFEILFNPKHEKFNQIYSLEEDQQENLTMAIKFASSSR